MAPDGPQDHQGWGAPAPPGGSAWGPPTPPPPPRWGQPTGAWGAPGPAPGPRRRALPIALGVVAALLVVGGAVAAIVVLASGGGSNRVTAAPTTAPVTSPSGSQATLPPDTATTSGGSTGPSSSLEDWLNATGSDVGTLNSDLQSLRTDNADPSAYDYTLAADDASSVQDDVQLLRDDPEPPTPALQQQWTKVLGDIDASAGGIQTAANGQDQAAVTAGLAQMAAAQDELDAFATIVSGGGG